jgi:hypothetical protein
MACQCADELSGSSATELVTVFPLFVLLQEMIILIIITTTIKLKIQQQNSQQGTSSLHKSFPC